MPKTPVIRIAKPPKRHKQVFAATSERWPPVLQHLAEHPGVWHRIKGASYADAIALRARSVRAMRGARWESRTRKRKDGSYRVWARFLESE